MIDVICDRVCLIYILMHNDTETNACIVIFSTMKKLCYHEGYEYGFGGLQNKILRRKGV